LVSSEGWLEKLPPLPSQQAMYLIYPTSLVGGLEHGLLFVHSVGNFIIPFDELHHFSEGWRKTTNQIIMKTINHHEPYFLTIILTILLTVY